MSRCDLSSDIRGGFSRGVPPLPIPNRAVKPARADGTDTPVGRVGRRRASGSPGRLMMSGAPFFVPVPVPLPFPAPGPAPGPASRPSPILRPPRPFPLPRPPRRRNGAEMFPGRAARHRWATERGRSVPRACAAAPLGDGIGCKCRPGVRRGAVRRRNGAEMSPERVVMPRWVTDSGRNVP